MHIKTNYVMRLDYTNIIILIILMNSLLKNAILCLNTFIQNFLKKNLIVNFIFEKHLYYEITK